MTRGKSPIPGWFYGTLILVNAVFTKAICTPMADKLRTSTAVTTRISIVITKIVKHSGLQTIRGIKELQNLYIMAWQLHISEAMAKKWKNAIIHFKQFVIINNLGMCY